jgi:hypothetical protein
MRKTAQTLRWLVLHYKKNLLGSGESTLLNVLGALDKPLTEKSRYYVHTRADIVLPQVREDEFERLAGGGFGERLREQCGPIS